METKIFYKDITGSTNQDMKELAAKGALEGTVICAKMQTEGRGRRGRSWVSEKGDSLLFSLLLRPDIAPGKAPQITLLMALAVTKVLRKQCDLDAKIKWPNDVVIGKKKVCGILTEMYLDGTKTDYIVVGCGINVNQAAMPEEIKGSATSLYLESNCVFAVEDLLQRVLWEFETYYELFLENGDLTPHRKEYDEWLVSRDAEVRVLDPKGEYTGVSRGINENGELLVELEDGTVNEVYAGEVSVRGLYGYV